MRKMLIIRWLPATGQKQVGWEKANRAPGGPTQGTAARPGPNATAHKSAHKPAKALAVLLGLFGDEGVEDAGLEVVDLHGALHLGEGLSCDLAGGF